MFATVPALMLAVSLITPVLDKMPDFDMRVTCKADAAARDGVPGQTAAKCLEDEEAARTKVQGQWTTFSAPLRSRCAAETQIGGPPSYVEMLVCLRIGAGLSPQ
jgi:hypothetical protein